MAQEQRPPSETVAPQPCCLPLWAALGRKGEPPAKADDGQEHAHDDESQEQVDGFKDGTSPASTASHESRRSWVSGLVARLRGQTCDGTAGVQPEEEDKRDDGSSKKGRKVRSDEATGDNALVSEADSPGSSLLTSTGEQGQETAEGEQQGAQQEEAPMVVVQDTATSHYINQEVEAAPSVDAVLEVVAAEAQVFTATICTNALARISRLGVRDHSSVLRLARDARFRSLLQTAAQHMDEARSGFGPSQQIQFLLAFARLGLQPEPELLAHLQQRIERDVGSYRCVELAGLLTAMVRLVSNAAPPAAARAKPTQDRDALIVDGICAPETPIWPPTPLLQVLEAQTVDSLAGGHGTGSMACNIYCSLCSLGHTPSQDLTWGLATRLLELELRSVDSHWLAHTLDWMGCHGLEPGRDFMFAARDEILRRMHDLPALDLAMCVSALGKLRPPPGEFFHRALLNHVGKRLQAFGSPQALALLINGLGNMNAAAVAAGAGGMLSPGPASPKNGGKGTLLISPKLLTGLLDLAATRLHKLKPTELANVLSGLAKLKVRPSTVFFLRTSAIVEARLGEFTPADLANVVYGMVRMKFHPTEQLVATIYAWSDAMLTMVEPRLERRRGGRRQGRHSRRHHEEEAEAEAEAEELAERQIGAAKVGALDLAYMLNVFVQLHLGGPNHGTMARVRDALMRPAAAPSPSQQHGDQGEQQQEEQSEASSEEEQQPIGRTSLLAQASIRSLSMIMWVFSRYEHHPGADFLEAVAETAFGGRGHGEEEDQEQEEDDEAEGSSSRRRRRCQATSEAALQTTVLLQALFRLGYVPTEGQLQGAMALLAPCLEELSPKTLFNTMYALAKWGAAPGESTAGQTFFEAWSSHAPRRFIPALTMPQLVVTAWALKTMGYQATTDVELGFRETLAVRSLTAMTDSEASSLAHSLQEIGVNVSAFAGLFRKKVKRDARPSPASGAGGAVPRAQALAANGRAYKPGAAAAVGKRGQQRQRTMRTSPTYRSGRLVEDDEGVTAGAESEDDDGNEDVMHIAMM